MKSTIRRFRLMGLLALPLVAIAVAVMAFSLSHSSAPEAAADFPHTGVDFSIDIDGCNGSKCSAPENAGFTVSVNLDSFGNLADYEGYDAIVDYTGSLTSKGTVDFVWPDSGFPAFAAGSGTVAAGSVLAINAPQSTYTGVLHTFAMNCGTGSGTLTLVSGSGNTNVASGGSHGESSDQVMTVNCVPATSTPTPTATPTPAPEPRFQKLPALQNEFLERQGSKVPPLTCLQGTDTGELAETLSLKPGGAVMKAGTNQEYVQELGAFEFEVHYDNDKICVTIEPAELSVDQVCTVQDSLTKSTLEGVARIGCVTVGKDNPMDTNATGSVIANLTVYPQPDVYSQAKPNQENGVVVQLNNVGCELADTQGAPIPHFSCEDADITFRYLEGDVTTDCSVDGLDTQSIAFRWGAEKGSLIYRDFMNLEPGGTQADNDIDIKDLQFVYGRFGSICGDEHPVQKPINPKA